MRGIFAIILACISVVALTNCGAQSSSTLPYAQVHPCVARAGQGGNQPSPIAVKPSPALPNEAMFGFDAQHTHYNSYEHILTPANVSKLVLDWITTTAKPIAITFLSSPTVANGVVYVGSNNKRLYAFKATTGAVLWSAFIGSGTSSTPAVANGIVYIGAFDSRLYAFKATTGTALWTASTGDSINSSPAVANGVVYVGSDGGKLCAFNATTGAVLWSTTPKSNVATYFGISSPAVANGVVYVDAGDFALYAFHLPG